MKIGVYGLGRFGSFWAKELSVLPHEVIAFSRSEHSVNEGVEVVGEESVLKSDILFFTVSISSFREVLKRTSPLIDEKTIVVDTCSVKTLPYQWMEENLKSEVSKIATHPMFGPDSGKNGIKGLTAVICPEVVNDDYFKVKDLLSSLSLNIVEMSKEEHDRKAAYSQAITHIIGRVLKEMNVEDTDIATLGFKSLLKVMENTCNDPIELFYDLQKFNPYAKEMREKLKSSFSKILDDLGGK